MKNYTNKFENLKNYTNKFVYRKWPNSSKKKKIEIRNYQNATNRSLKLSYVY